MATKDGMKPILANGIHSFVSEPDVILAEQALAANLKLVEGVVETYPNDRTLLLMAAMARGNYAFGFIHDDLEANRIAAPEDRTTQQRLVQRTVDSYRKGRGYAERALRLNDDFAQRVGDRPFEAVSSDTFAKALSSLDKEDADALFWLAFNWGGTLQATLNPADAVQLPKLEAISERVLELDDGVFYGLGPHLLAGVLKG